MGNIIKMVLGALAGNTGVAQVGGAAVNLVSLAALVPGALYLLNHWDLITQATGQVVYCVTLGDVGLIGALFAGIVKVAHILKSPNG